MELFTKGSNIKYMKKYKKQVDKISYYSFVVFIWAIVIWLLIGVIDMFV